MSEFLTDRFLFSGLQDLGKSGTFRRYEYHPIKDTPNSKVLAELYGLFKNNKSFEGYDIYEAAVTLAPLYESEFINSIYLTFNGEYIMMDEWWLNLIETIDDLHVYITFGVLWTVTSKSKSSRKQISSRLRVQVLDRDNSTCQLCGATLKDGIKLHVDHIIPVSKGGTNEINNLQTLCESCNLGKGDFTDLNMVKNKLEEG